MANTDVVEKQPLTEDYLKKMDAYWRATNYLGAAQLYLLDNPLLREPLTMEHVKKKIVGHWGTVPGQNFIYVHLNRVIKKYDPVSYTHQMWIRDRLRTVKSLLLYI